MSDPSLHLPRAVLEERLRRLPSPPQTEGSVVLVVVRPEPGQRLTPPRCRLSPEGGVEGDRWLQRDPRIPEAQIAVMRADVAQVIANGQPLSLFGDNLLVDLDLSPQSLPPGTRLRVGTALCEVTPKPHTGCKKFGERFGQDGRDVVGADETKDMRLRGIYFRVIEEGEAGPGDRILVLREQAARQR
jgi:MOSC domain-containing protein YiiM